MVGPVASAQRCVGATVVLWGLVVLFGVGSKPLFVRVSRVGPGVVLMKRDQPTRPIPIGGRVSDGFRLKAVAVHGVEEFRLAFALESSVGGPQTEVARLDFDPGSGGELEAEVRLLKTDVGVVVVFSKL